LKGNLKLISGSRIRSPLTNLTRPTTSKVREAILNILGGNLKEACWLDLCSGSGVMSCEVLQKGAKRILAIEKQKATAQICKLNLEEVSKKLNFPNHVEVVCNEVTSFLKKGPKNKKIKFFHDFPNDKGTFDLIFLDPPYNSEIYKTSQDLLLSKKWIKRSSILIYECSSKTTPTIHNGWELNKQKFYGKTSLLFLTPNQALSCFDDTDSMR